MQLREKAKPLMTFLELQATYENPMFEMSKDGSGILPAVFEAFKPWNLALANISTKQSHSNLAEIATVFNLQNSQITFSVGIGAATLLVTNPDWSQEQRVSEIAMAGFQAVQKGGEITYRQFLISLLMHLKPERRTFHELSAEFLKFNSPRMSSPSIRGRGFSVYADDFAWVVDASAMYQGALFVKLVRNFGATASFSEMAMALRTDQGELLGALQLTVD